MALLMTADLAPGRISLGELERRASESGSSVAAAIDACSQVAWHQDIWKRIKVRYTKPATVPAGELTEILKTLTLYWLWGRDVASFSQVDTLASPASPKSTRQEILDWLEDVANSTNGASIEGLVEIDIVDADGSSPMIGRDANVPYFGTLGGPKF